MPRATTNTNIQSNTLLKSNTNKSRWNPQKGRNNSFILPASSHSSSQHCSVQRGKSLVQAITSPSFLGHCMKDLLQFIPIQFTGETGIAETLEMLGRKKNGKSYQYQPHVETSHRTQWPAAQSSLAGFTTEETNSQHSCLGFTAEFTPEGPTCFHIHRLMLPESLHPAPHSWPWTLQVNTCTQPAMTPIVSPHPCMHAHSKPLEPCMSTPSPWSITAGCVSPSLLDLEELLRIPAVLIATMPRHSSSCQRPYSCWHCKLRLPEPMRHWTPPQTHTYLGPLHA